MAVGYNPRVVTDGLVLALDAGNTKSYSGSGATWTDLSGNGNNGTLENGVGFNGSNGGSLSFDGVDDRVLSISNTGISGSSSRSLCVFCYPTATSGNFYSVARIGSANDGRLFELMVSGNSVVGHFWGGGFSLGATSGKTLLNNHSYLVMTYNGSTVSIYVDGLLKASGNFSLNTTNSQLTLGLKTYSGHVNYQGRQSIFQLYNRALTAAEVTQNYNATKGRYA